MASSQLVRRLLKDLRGSATQKQMSARLGYTHNQWHKWESGQKRLMWEDLEKIAGKLKLNLEQAKRLVVTTGRKFAPSGQSFALAIVDEFGGPDSVLAKKELKISEARLHRLKRSKQDVEVSFVFDCISKLSSTLPSFVEELTKKTKNSVFQDSTQSAKEQVALEVEYPWVSLIEACLELEAYKKLPVHSDVFIAKQVGFPLALVKLGLIKLVESKYAYFKNKKYHLNQKRIDLPRIEDAAKFYKFLSEMCRRRFTTFDGVPSSRSGLSGRVVPASEAAHKEVNELRLKFFNDLNKIFQSDRDRPKTHIMVLVQHLFDDQEVRNLKIFE